MGGSLEPSLGHVAMALLPWMTLMIGLMAWGYGGMVMAREEAVHQVGGTPGWSLPSRSMVNYTQWAATQMFVVGDTLCKCRTHMTISIYVTTCIITLLGLD